MALVDYFLKLDGIDGESTDEKHKNEIDVESFGWGVSRTGTLAHDRGASQATFQDLSFTSFVSRASPRLMLACARGDHIKRAVLAVERRDTEKPETLMTFMFNDVTVGLYKQAGADSPVDQSSLAYTSVVVNGQGTEPPPPSAPLTVAPTASGALVRYMDDGTTEIAPSEDPTQLQSGYVSQQFVARQFRRGVAEFDLSQTLVAGFAKGPAAAKAKYELILTNVTPPPSGGGEVISDPGLGTHGDVGPGQHAVSSYGAPDLEVAVDDYDRDAAALGKIMNTAPGASHAFDVTALLNASTARTVGFRVQLQDDPDRTGFASIGSLFRAELHLTLT